MWDLSKVNYWLLYEICPVYDGQIKKKTELLRFNICKLSSKLQITIEYVSLIPAHDKVHLIVIDLRQVVFSKYLHNITWLLLNKDDDYSTITYYYHNFFFYHYIKRHSTPNPNFLKIFSYNEMTIICDKKNLWFKGDNTNRYLNSFH